MPAVPAAANAVATALSKAALRGDGSAYGITDPTTAAGADPAAVLLPLRINFVKF